MGNQESHIDEDLENRLRSLFFVKDGEVDRLANELKKPISHWLPETARQIHGICSAAHIFNQEQFIDEDEIYYPNRDLVLNYCSLDKYFGEINPIETVDNTMVGDEIFGEISFKCKEPFRVVAIANEAAFSLTSKSGVNYFAVNDSVASLVAGLNPSQRFNAFGAASLKINLMTSEDYALKVAHSVGGYTIVIEPTILLEPLKIYIDKFGVYTFRIGIRFQYLDPNQMYLKTDSSVEFGIFKYGADLLGKKLLLNELEKGGNLASGNPDPFKSGAITRINERSGLKPDFPIDDKIYANNSGDQLAANSPGKTVSQENSELGNESKSSEVLCTKEEDAVINITQDCRVITIDKKCYDLTESVVDIFKKILIDHLNNGSGLSAVAFDKGSERMKMSDKMKCCPTLRDLVQSNGKRTPVYSLTPFLIGKISKAKNSKFWDSPDNPRL